MEKGWRGKGWSKRNRAVRSRVSPCQKLQAKLEQCDEEQGFNNEREEEEESLMAAEKIR